MKRLQLLVVTLAMVGAALLPGQVEAANRAGAVTLSPYAGEYQFEGNQYIENCLIDDSPIYGLAIGYNLTERLGWELSLGYIEAEAKTGDIDNVDGYLAHLDLLYHFRPDKAFVPFVVGGLGAVSYRAGGDARNDENALFNLGAGFKYFLLDNVALRADVRGLLDIDTGDSSREHDNFKNLAMTGGLTFQFGGEKESVEPMQEAVVLPVSDADADGVSDDHDRCLGTPAGVPVDAEGCPRDSDGDGVADYLDRCPRTPAGTAVDAGGCPLVPPADDDGDGVVNADDKCPNTPAGMSVNPYGCPRDDDRDGVFNYEDECPDTPEGTEVGPDGCPVPTEPESMTLQFNFPTNSASIQPEFEGQLEAAAEFINAHPGTHVTIEGHTDSVGRAAYNLELSQRRADSVRDYLIEHFDVEASRLEAIGYGESKPVAENNTPEGRIMNRRVVILIEGK